jgi:hypothetical protein
LHHAPGRPSADRFQDGVEHSVRWLLRAEGGGLDPHTAVAVRVAFQASSIPDGFTFLVARFSVSGPDVTVARRDSLVASPD